MLEPDLVFQISGEASPTIAMGRVTAIEEAVEKSKKVAWCNAIARIHGQPAILDITVNVKVVSDYTLRSVVGWVNKTLCELAFGQQFFTAQKPGLVSLVEPIELLPTIK